MRYTADCLRRTLACLASLIVLAGVLVVPPASADTSPGLASNNYFSAGVADASKVLAGISVGGDGLPTGSLPLPTPDELCAASDRGPSCATITPATNDDGSTTLSIEAT